MILKLIAILIPLTFGSGCSKPNPKTSPQINKPEISSSDENDRVSLLAAAQRLYASGQEDEALKSLDLYEKTEKKQAESHFLRGLIDLSKNNIEGSITQFSSISDSERQLMTESCLELARLSSRVSNDVMKSIITRFFPDCLEEVLGMPDIVEVRLTLSPERILELGKIYETRLKATEDESIRVRIEQDFCREFNLSIPELTELSTRYLELLAEKD
ncbi:MAG: hypothetical protein H3C47_15310 [Candidatus Cloacimonetes bacterium]|nr:hypothetical protein [Candidatus Cloacimonadota bacterium]